MATVDELQQRAIDFADKATKNMEFMRDKVSTFPIGAGTVLLGPDGIPIRTEGFARTVFSEKTVTAGMAIPAVPDDLVLPPLQGTPPANFNSPTIVALTLENVPQFTMAAPTISLPAAPHVTLPDAPGAAPTFNSPVLPAAPNLTMPDVPTFEPVALPVAPNLVMPAFTSKLPVDDIVAPSTRFTFAEQAYHSAALDALKAKLMSDLSNGGYGIETADEASLWARARDRELRNGEAKIQDAVRQVASRGFTMPPGALNALISQAQQDAQAASSTLSRDIALKRADMYVENRKFTIEQVKEVESILIQYYGSMMERALNASKTLVEMSIAVFNARVAKYNQQIEAYKASAQVYETLIRAATLQLESYKTQVEGAKLSFDAQKVHIDVYKAQLDGVQSLIGLYTSRLGATRILVDVEQAKLTAFRTNVESYAAQVGAQVQTLQVYDAQIRGETAKVAAYSTAAGAYGSRVSAYATAAGVAETNVRAQIATGQFQLDAYKSDIGRYSMELERSNTLINQAIAVNGSQLKKYGLNADVTMKKAELELSASKENAELSLRVAQAKSAADLTLEGIIDQGYASRTGLFSGLAQAYGSLGSAAVSSAIGISTAALAS